MQRIRVAVCGELPTAVNYLLTFGVVQIDRFQDATEIKDESDYQLLLVYAPQAEGLLNVVYTRHTEREGDVVVPVRLLNEPCCHSALLELKSTILQIERRLEEPAAAALSQERND
jgi:hypothetical protein